MQLASKDMQAVLATKPGSPQESLRLSRVQVPKLREGELLVRNSVAGFNFLDTQIRKGAFGSEGFPRVLGIDGCGHVAEVAHGIADSQPSQGERVAYISPSGGSYAEYVSVPASQAIKVPEGMSTETACAGMIQGMTAVAFAMKAYPTHPGSTVLVHAAAGGTGQLLCQVARACGARVIGTTSTPEKASYAKECGAHEVILYTEQDILKEVMHLTGGVGVDAVFDSLGVETFETSLRCLKHLGTLISFGSATGKIPPIATTLLMPNNAKLMRPSVFSFLSSSPTAFKELAELTFELIQSGKLKINIHAVYPLEQAARGHEDLEQRRTKGKVLLAL